MSSRYDQPGAILDAVLMMQLAQQRLMKNRTLIQGLMNGDTPYTDDEAQAENVNTNVNFLEGSRICSNATNQINRYFFGSDRFFTLNYDRGPAAQRRYVSDVCTKLVNREMKKSRLYRSARETAHAQVVLHGPGPLLWRNRRSPLPTTAGMEDILIPSATLCDMSNMDMFAVYTELVWSQLWDAAFGETADPGWNKGYVTALLDTLYGLGLQPIYQGNRWLFPEKLAEDYKEGASQTFSSSMPKVLAWNFFYRNEDSGKWNRRVILDYANIATIYPNLKDSDAIMQQRQLLYERDDFADDWQEILHLYIGNCSNKAPYRYHSIRSIGYLLFGVCMLSNKAMCRRSDAVFQNMITLFRNISEDNREKLGLIDLQNFGIVPDGVSFVQAQERHTIDTALVDSFSNQLRQYMAESSSAFVPDMQSALGAGGKELTATEALIRQNTSVTLTNAVLSQLGDQSLYEYREIWRRFCMKGNPDPAAVRFREGLKQEGIPLDVLDYDHWAVQPETVVGSGNKASELTVTQALLQELFPLVDPNAQRIILRRRWTALTDNPDEAMEAVPPGPNPAMADDVQYASFAFTILMEGLPFDDKEGTNHVVMAGTLMQMAQMALQQAQAVVNQPDGHPLAAQKVAGAANVLQHVQMEVQKVAQAPLLKVQARQLIGQFQQLNGEMQQVAKAVQAVGEQQAQSMDPETAKLQAKLQEMQATGEMQRQIDGQNAQQKMQQKQAAWQMENERRNADTAAEQQRKTVDTVAQVHRDAALTAADIHHQTAKTMVELRNKAVQADADAELTRKKAAATSASK